jgi:hypothetical protein
LHLVKRTARVIFASRARGPSSTSRVRNVEIMRGRIIVRLRHAADVTK